MNAVAATLRATLRLQGSLLFWLFYGFLLALAMLFLAAGGDVARKEQGALFPVLVLAFASWMGWMLFLSRLWQLQRHAESLQLPGARRDSERAALLLVLAGVWLPTLLLVALGAPLGWTLLAQCLAVATVLVYLMVTPAVGAFLLMALSVLPIVGGKWLRPLLPDLDTLFHALWLLVAVLLAIGLPRWRALMRQTGETGWNAPQVITLAERGLSGSRVREDDPSMQWLSHSSDARVGRVAGPDRPVLAGAIILCGPLAPLGWRNYLRNTGWMLLAIGVLGLFALSGASEGRGPQAALVALLAVWSLLVPFTLIARLRQLWQDEGHGLAEASLLPGLQRGAGSWPALVASVLYTTLYRLALPVLLVMLLIAIKAGDARAPLLPVLISAWSILLCMSLLPLARRRGMLAGFLLYLGVGMVVVGVLVAQFFAAAWGSEVLWRVLLPVSAPVLLLAAAGWRLPQPGRPLVQP